jgi:pilus assembly protein CpaC
MRSRLLALAASVAWLAAQTPPAAQTPLAAQTPPAAQTPLAAQTPPAARAQPEAQELRLSAGRSTVIDYATDIARLSTSNAEVADAVAASTREVLINAKSTGTATVILWDRSGHRTAYAITVEQNLDPVRELLRQTFPDAQIQIQAARDAVALTGTVPNQATSDRAAALVAPFGKAVVNNLRVVTSSAERQVLLRVKFAELNRSASSALGVNLISTGAGNTPAGITTGQFQNPMLDRIGGTIPGRNAGTTTQFTISDALNIFAFRPDLNLAAFIKALQSQGVLQILAEPTLVAINGKEASFLVGGEFPIPVVQGGVNAGSVTIMFKEFGIRLTFQPTITEHNTIRMHVKPEVSTIDLANSVLYSGFTIPALATRRMETDIELGEGQSFVIAGLIDQRVTENLSKIPGLSQIPILGALFHSRQEQRSSTELIVMVTPEIATPGSHAGAGSMPPMPKTFLEPYRLERRPGAAARHSSRSSQPGPTAGAPLKPRR